MCNVNEMTEDKEGNLVHSLRNLLTHNRRENRNLFICCAELNRFEGKRARGHLMEENVINGKEGCG
jgi:hypothetical protein